MQISHKAAVAFFVEGARSAYATRASHLVKTVGAEAASQLVIYTMPACAAACHHNGLSLLFGICLCISERYAH